MSAKSPPFLVVGGGIGGFGCALALARRGFSSIVLEQAPEFGEIGAGLQLGPNVFRMFDKLGITAEINKWAVYPKGLMMRDVVTGDEVTTLPLNDAFLARFKFPYGVIHRVDLHRVLMEECAKLPAQITTLNGKKIVDIDDRDRCPGLREGERDGLTQPGARARDERHGNRGIARASLEPREARPIQAV